MITTKNTTLKKSLNKYSLSKDIIIEAIFSALIFAIMIIIISNPKRYTSVTIGGLKLFFFSVLPGLFPFMLLTKLLTEIGFVFKATQKLNTPAYILFGTKGISIYAFLMSILSGYPIGAKIISDLYVKNLITESDAKKMAVFCTTSGPIFVIGAVGAGMFGSFKIGVVLYLSHILSSTILGIIYGNIKKKKENKNDISTANPALPIKKDNVFGECVLQTINSLFVVGAYITIFYLLGEILQSLGVFNLLIKTLSPLTQKLGMNNSLLSGVLYGILEVTRGAKELSVCISPLSICLCSGLLSFSGISIIMQSMVFLKQAKIKMHNFVLTKVIHSIFSMISCFIFCLLFI